MFVSTCLLRQNGTFLEDINARQNLSPKPHFLLHPSPFPLVHLYPLNGFSARPSLAENLQHSIGMRPSHLESHPFGSVAATTTASDSPQEFPQISFFDPTDGQ